MASETISPKHWACVDSAAAEATTHGRIVGPSQDANRFLQTSARSRLLSFGPQALSDVELLSLLLHSNGRTPVHTLAANLLTAYGSLRQLLLADRHAARAHGLTPSSYVGLQAALEIARRHYQEIMMTGPVVSQPCSIRQFVRMRLRDLPHEVFAIIYLNTHYHVIHFEELFRGTIDGAIVHPREVVKGALARNASAIIAVHNHPSGIPEPSQSDLMITRRLKEALALVDIKLLDHLIVGDSSIESFAERGFL